MRDRLRRVTDLFVDGTVVELPDGSYLWAQALNPYERDECVSDAQVARARLVMAMREAGTERLKVEARLDEVGRQTCVTELAGVKADEKYQSFIAEVQDDPEWTERMDIIRRTDFNNAAKPPTDEEVTLIAKIEKEFFAEVRARADAERDYQIKSLERLSDEDFLSEYAEAWMEKRGAALGQAEFSLTELWLCIRLCEATKNADGDYDHSACGTHEYRLFDSKADARTAPAGLQDKLTVALRELQMGTRDPKDLGSPRSSSGS
jgi:hypothetical protein